MRTAAIAITLTALALLFAACGDDDAAVSDVDSDTEDEWCTYDPHYQCTEYCHEGQVVQSDPAGTPATVEAICADGVGPVVSTGAAVVELSAVNEGLVEANGFIRIPADLADSIVDLPEVDFATVYGEGGPWAACEITDLAAVEGGFGFHAYWPQISTYSDCDVGYTHILLRCRVRLQLECGLVDGGVPDDAGTADGGIGGWVDVEAVTYLEWCESQSTSCLEWYSSGELCPSICVWEWLDDCE
jgi:hypothetical protein